MKNGLNGNEGIWEGQGQPVAHTLEPISVRIATAVELTGICRSTIYELIGDGTIETVKIGRSTFILYPSLKRLFERS
jgi:excisionase family DNA binding protein